MFPVDDNTDMNKSLHIAPELHFRLKMAAVSRGIALRDMVAELLTVGLESQTGNHCKPNSKVSPRRSTGSPSVTR